MNKVEMRDIMGEIKYDKKFSIKTTGIKEWHHEVIHYNRCEPTPYHALDRLFKHYKLHKTDRLVDFGSGRGRVAFYIHNRFHIPVVGIEAQDDVYDEAIKNKKRYRQRAKHIEAPIYFEYGLAENYEIEPMDNRFYFFNPFSAEVFKKVVDNILISIEEVKREVDIILYYPMPKYKKILKNNTPFEFYNKVKIPNAKDKKEKFLIYRYT